MRVPFLDWATTASTAMGRVAAAATRAKEQSRCVLAAAQELLGLRLCRLAWARQAARKGARTSVSNRSHCSMPLAIGTLGSVIAGVGAGVFAVVLGVMGITAETTDVDEGVDQVEQDADELTDDVTS